MIYFIFSFSSVLLFFGSSLLNWLLFVFCYFEVDIFIMKGDIFCTKWLINYYEKNF